MNLTLVDGLVVVWAHELVNEEEVISILGSKFAANVEVCFLVVDSLLLICNYLYVAALASGTLVALNALLKCLIGGSNNFVHCKLNLSNEIMACIVVQSVKVINIINDNSIVLALLKVIWNFKVLNPLWIKVVHDYFSFS